MQSTILYLKDTIQGTDNLFTPEFEKVLLDSQIQLELVKDLENGPNLAELLFLRFPILEKAEYLKFNRRLKSEGITLLTTPYQYNLANQINYYYNWIDEYTAPTRFFYYEDSESFKNAIRPLFDSNSAKLFIKGVIKSNSGVEGSVADSVEKANRIVKEMQEYYGLPENIVVVRNYRDFLPESEKRYFVVRGEIISPDTESIPYIVKNTANILSKLTPFYCIDFGKTKHGLEEIIEIGDGQVSSPKGWDLDEFIQKVLYKL